MTRSKKQNHAESIAELLESKVPLREEAKRVTESGLGVEPDHAEVVRRWDGRYLVPRISYVWKGKVLDFEPPWIAINAAPAGNGELPAAPDFLPGYYADHREEILAGAREQIEDSYTFNDRLTLSAEEKQRRLRALREDMLKIDRVIAAHVWASHEEGEGISFPGDIDPRAVLGVEGPAPTKRR